MRPRLYLPALVTLLCAAGAGQASTAESIRPETMPAIERSEASADAAPVLDLSFDPPLPAEQPIPAVTPDAAPAPAARDAEAPFSVGLDIKTRREAGGPVRPATADPEDSPTLTDKVEGIVERSAIGVTGTYRF